MNNEKNKITGSNVTDSAVIQGGAGNSAKHNSQGLVIQQIQDMLEKFNTGVETKYNTLLKELRKNQTPPPENNDNCFCRLLKNQRK